MIVIIDVISTTLYCDTLKETAYTPHYIMKFLTINKGIYNTFYTVQFKYILTNLDKYLVTYDFFILSIYSKPLNKYLKLEKTNMFTYM